MPSLEIKVLLIIAFAACIYLFIAEIRRSRRISMLIAWVEANYPEDWNALPWANRKINRLGGLALLSKRGVISDQYFAVEYNATKPFRKNQNIAFIIAAGAIALVLIGVKLNIGTGKRIAEMDLDVRTFHQPAHVARDRCPVPANRSGKSRMELAGALYGEVTGIESTKLRPSTKLEMSRTGPAQAARRAIVIGGSMSGLFSAAFLTQIGWDVDVYERSHQELAGRGAGITGHPELLEALEASGAGIERLGIEVQKRVAIDRALSGPVDVPQQDTPSVPAVNFGIIDEVNLGQGLRGPERIILPAGQSSDRGDALSGRCDR